MQRFVTIAIDEALKSNMYNKHGAVLVYRNKLISKGHNVYDKYTRLKSGKYRSIHAEVMAINNCPNQDILSKCKLIVVRVASGKKKMSLPCKYCQKFLKKKKVLKIYHS
ncbi:hypothetical protein CL622_01445 [archaeon]|nr:hypothetical protein [archaeon]